MKRKICVITGSRAEFGLLYWLLKDLQADHAFELQLVVTGAPASDEEFERQAEADGFTLANRVKTHLALDSAQALTKALGEGVTGFSDVIAQLKPDLAVVLGDRYEIFAAVIAAHMARIPVAHIHGGETSEGAVDEAFRHSITKMAQLHFAAAEVYRKRIIQLGEHPERVFTVGAMAGANFHRAQLLSKQELEQALQFSFGPQNLLVTFHPETLSHVSPAAQMQELLRALNELPDTRLIFTLPNADARAAEITRLIKDYAARNPEKAVWFASLGRLRYLSVLQVADGVVGNSSSGLIEAPFFRKPTLNIGDRQKGRLKSAGVLDCAANYAAIRQGLTELLSPEFQKIAASAENPYGNTDPVPAIVQVLKTTELSNLVQKSFFDISITLPG